MNNVPTLMSGMELTGHGGLDKLVFKSDIPVPKPSPFEVLIKVGAAGVNNTDLNTRIGWYSKSNKGSSDASWTGSALQFPLIQGADVCGEIMAIGEQVDPIRLHERVLVEPCILELGGKVLDQPMYFGSDFNGGFSQYTVVDARYAHKISSQLSDVELASFPCSYSTAENLLTRASVSEKDVVLITGASGGVGSAAIQLAKARGAKVIAITSDPKAEMLLKLGADRTLSRSANLVQDLGMNSVDVVIDLVAGKQWPNLLDVLKPFGRYAVSGAIGGPFVELDVRSLYLKDLSLFGCTVLDKNVFPNLIRRIEAGEISPLVANIFSLAQIQDAQTQFETKEHIGKLVIDMSRVG